MNSPIARLKMNSAATLRAACACACAKELTSLARAFVPGAFHSGGATNVAMMIASKLALRLDAGVSARHLSFVETGRSKPGREMLLRVAEQLGVPFRERNQLLLAAGHAPAFPERALEDPELAGVREALELILRGHEPYPALVVDRYWNLVTANAPISALAAAVINPALLEPPVNA